MPAEKAEGSRLSVLQPYPFEIVTWLGVASAVLFLRSRGLRIDWKTVEYTIPPLIPVMAKTMLAGIALFALYELIRRRPPLAYLRRILTLDWLLLTARLWLAIALFTYSYFWLKVCVPLINTRLWDQAFWRLDAVLHLGFSPSVLSIELFRDTGLLPWIDLWYAWWLPSVSFTIAFFCAFPEQRVRRAFILSCVLIWTLGSWLYTALPALGPIYLSQEVWEEATPQMPRAQNAQRLLMKNYQTVVEGRSGGLRQFNPTRGVAAMPSLHVGVHWLLALWIRRCLRPLFLVALLATLLTLLGSVVTGWHYAIDGYVGILLAQGVFWLACRWERSPEDEAAPPPAAAADEQS